MIWLRARCLLPVTAPPLEDAGVCIQKGKIVRLGRWRDLRRLGASNPKDLGDVLLMPGLVNAHCHLDYTHMAGGLPAPRYFPDWLKGMLAYKAHWGFSEYAQSWLDGARMLLESGTTTVADIEAVPELLSEVWPATPLRVFSLLELTNVRSRRNPKDLLDEAAGCFAPLPRHHKYAGLSPHALYSTTPALVKAASVMCRRHHWPMAMHVAESVDEFEMFTRAAGRMYDWLRGQRDMSDCQGNTPVEQLYKFGVLGPRFLAIHANYATPDDIPLLAKTGTNVVHCPRSHCYFKHRPFPLRAMLESGVNVCLGTDSLASVSAVKRNLLQLNMFLEMREISLKFPNLPPQRIVEMATINGARALGMAKRIGHLAENSCADMVALPIAPPLHCPYEYLVKSTPKPVGVMIHGQWVARTS